MNTPSPGHRLRDLLLGSVLVLGFGVTAIAIVRQGRRIDEVTTALRTNEAVLQEILGEVTRARLEQRSDALGPKGLLDKLRTYAPLLTSSRTTEPDYRSAKGEMDSILRALGTIGADAWGPVTKRLGEVKADKDYDEARWLLRAATRIDPKAGKEIVKEVLAGTRLPSPRMRLDAARLMLEIDRQLAQHMLRRILRTESARGVNIDRATAQGEVLLPDPAALTSSGFFNYIAYYIESGDDEIDETLLMVIGRAEHDLTTVQECVKALGKRKCERAVDAIQKLFEHPPNNIENPMFQCHCLTALHEIQGERARPFLEDALKKATTETVANHCRTLLAKI